MAIPENVPIPEKGEDEADFIGRCMEEMRGEGYRLDQARQLCAISWQQDGENPPPENLWRDPLLVAPPPIRDDIPDLIIELFDTALGLGRTTTEADILRAIESLSQVWTASEFEEELRRIGNLERFLEDGEPWVDFRGDLRDSWEGVADPDTGLRARADAPMVQVFVGSSDASAVTSPIPDNWWKTERWTQEAISWVDRVGATRVTAVSDGTKGGIRQLIQTALEDGSDRDWIARTMAAMDGDGSLRLGLDAPRSRTFMKFVNSLDPSLPPGRRRRLIDRRYKQLVRARAKVIAQTEVVTIANEAQVATYQAAAQEGALNTQVYVMEWVARAIACKRCIAMDGATREINSGRFVSDGSGPRGVETAEMPDLHPNGWCFTRIIRRSEAERQPVVTPGF